MRVRQARSCVWEKMGNSEPWFLYGGRGVDVFSLPPPGVWALTCVWAAVRRTRLLGLSFATV